jgi:carboxyl-terminal processing protease
MKARHTFLLLIIFISNQINAQLFNENSFKFNRTLDYINALYVDTVNQQKLVETAIREMLNELDPHSSYLTAQEVKEMNEPLQGNFEGIGVTFNILNDTIFIINPIAGGPSERVGVMSGDKIIRIDGENVAGKKINNKFVFSKLRGAKGTKVTISVLRKGEKELLDFTITRDKIPIYSIDAVYMVDKETGYIKLDRFAQTSDIEFEKAIKKLKESKVKNLILDLSDNGGGYLEEAVLLADHFLDEDKLIVYTKGVHSPKQEYKSRNLDLFEKGKLVVIIDENSASASEIFAGAIQDWDRGIIIGRRSFGKGLVQRPLMYPDGSMLRLTIAHYYTPSGRDIQKPYSKGFDEYEKDIINRYNNGELSNKDSIHFPDSLKCYTLIKQRVIYGGGGIMPDIFVPIDTSNYSEYYRDLIRKGILNKFVLNYIDENRIELSTKYPDFKTFKSNFASDTLLKKLVVFADKEGLNPNDEQINTSKTVLIKLLKAYIARDLWDSNEFFEIYNEDDPIFLEAIKAIKYTELPRLNEKKK